MMTRRFLRAARRGAAAALVAPLLAACSDFVDNETSITRPDPAAGGEFRTYMALGTSLGAGFESGGINDSTQREGYPFRLAVAMGLTPGVDWQYPGLRLPGCPAPLTDPLAGRRVGGATATGCALRTAASNAPVIHNLSIPGLRAAHILNVTDLTFPVTDTLKLAQFITSSRNPIDVVEAVSPTFVTLEIGANDVLGAATRGDTTLLTPAGTFSTTFAAIADRLDAAGARVAVANVPNVTRIPFFTRASTIWCLKTGLCTGVPATPPFNSPLFVVDNSCAPGAAGGIGDTYLVTFPATGAIVSTLAAARAATLNCATDVATVQPPPPAPATPQAPAGATLNPTETAAIAARVTAFNNVISQQATTRTWAVANIDSALGANAAQIPPVPGFSTPLAVFGTFFSQDGVHPNRAGYALMATVFRNAINARFGTSIAAIP